MKKQLIFILFLSFSFTCFAQFGGGRGDGVDKSGTVQTSLSGIIGGITPLYQGGAGDGFDHNIISTFLNGANTNMLYSGGSGDGFVSNAASLFLNGTNLTSLYSGGSGDGFDKETFNGFLNNTGAIVLYNGGSGDGFDKKIFSGIIDGTPTEIFYSGGVGDGFDHAQIQAYLSGTSFNALYNGGEGDGFAKAEFSGTLIVLPLELISFDAAAKENYVLVKWVTASEQDNDFFTVERSQNGMLFNNLVVVPSQGNSNTIQTYTINDNNPLKGRSYYRLKFTDVEGRSEYSDIRSVLFENNNAKDFLLFPNPNEGNTVFVQLDGIAQNENIAISLADVQGKIIYKSQNPTLTGNRIKINLPRQLAKGSYIVQVIRNGETSSKVLMVR